MAAGAGRAVRAAARVAAENHRGEFMRPSLYVTPVNDTNLKLAAQVGATDIVAPWPGTRLDDMTALRDQVAAHGLKLSVIERMMPHSEVVHGSAGRDKQIEDIKAVVRHMGACGVPVLCYNFMPSDDWTRTAIDVPERGGALVTEFDEAKVEEAPELEGQTITAHITSSEELWANLEHFLREVVPVAEEAGVVLALHPDDPPMPMLRGKPQIIYDVDCIERAVKLVPSPSNGVCFCQGTFASAGVDIPAAIRRLGDAIKFVHFRDVVGTVPHFREAWQDTGDSDMVDAIAAYKEIGFTGPIRPDHVPTMEGESNEHPGYHMMGRLWAIGYIKGIMQALAHDRR